MWKHSLRATEDGGGGPGPSGLSPLLCGSPGCFSQALSSQPPLARDCVVCWLGSLPGGRRGKWGMEGLALAGRGGLAA